MEKIKILWADDEIDILKPQLLFLRKKGYEVITVTNGYDAIEEVEQADDFAVIFLDESMPGITGLETLDKIKSIRSHLPVVMITKNEAEGVMEQAIGSQIADYLIKPVNPNQILLSLKKIIDNKRLVSEKNTTEYQQQFRSISMDINSSPNHEEWAEIYKKIIRWELKLNASNSDQMGDILTMQKQEANREFSKYINRNYLDWIQERDTDDSPILSHKLFRQKAVSNFSEDRPTIFLLLDNLRFDQWKAIEPIFRERFSVENEDHFYSILPTSTQYSRNAIFSGMTPLQISKKYRSWWVNDNEPGGKNNYEKELLGEQLKRLVRRPLKWEYYKIVNLNSAKRLADDALNFLNNDLTVIVYNFIDMLSHARTEMEVLKELANDEQAYRSLTKSWFIHSPLWTALQKLSEKDIQLMVTTDHGTIRVKSPSKVVGDKETTTNLRYKTGKNLSYNRGDVLAVRDPEEAQLPRQNLSSTYIFAQEDSFFVYPNNYNYFQNYYRDTFQHGGISLEEIICPFITLKSKR